MNRVPAIFPKAVVILFLVFSVTEASVETEVLTESFLIPQSFGSLITPMEGMHWISVAIVSIIILPSYFFTFLYYRRWKQKCRHVDSNLEKEIRYQDIFENPFVPMLIVNPNNGRIVDVNQIALDFYAYSKQEMLNFHLWDINILSREELDVEMKKAKNEKRNTFRFRHRLKSGEIKDVEVFSGPVMIKGEKLLFSTIRDISNVLEWEKGLIEAKLEAETASRAKDDLLSVISHEMRTPLNPIIGFSTLLMGELDHPEHIKQLEIINESAERLKQLIGDVLQFSKLTAGVYELSEHSFDLGRMLHSIKSMFNQDCGRNELLIENGTGKEMQLLDDGNQLIGDAGVLHHILGNLVGNACKYTTGGRVVIRYGVLEENEKNCRIRIEVEDNGIGIADDLKERIFEPFAQAETSFSRSFEGVGLGLAICRRLIGILDGELKLESELGRGSRFWIDVWLKKSTSVDETMKQSDTESDSKQYQRIQLLNRRVKILLVEDSPFNTAYITRFIEKIGCHCRSFNNGMEAFTAFKSENFDVVLMDLSLPHIDGFETTQMIRDYEGNDKSVPIIALTAHQSAKVRERCLCSGFDEFVEKPVHPNTLYQVLCSTLKVE